MLRITIPETEQYDEVKDEFVVSKAQVLHLEHSLVSLSKWESSWTKPFLTKEDKTLAESIDYVRCMTITQNVSPEVYNFITRDVLGEVSAYIEAPMTATTFSRSEGKSAIQREIITAEIIYYWMVALAIPFECQRWHLNRLLTLINVCNLKNQPPKRMGKKEAMTRNRSLNAARRQQYNTSG